MELIHHFEVPVDLDNAWTYLLDLSRVAACFPGATLLSADGSNYVGVVKVKLGPIQLLYKGSAQIVSVDEASHTATVKASGAAARSGSTATMTVVATASATGPDRTVVRLATDLAITGRPAQFGRGVIVEVGNKILGQFAECLSATLAGARATADAADEATAAIPGHAPASDEGTPTADPRGMAGPAVHCAERAATPATAPAPAGPIDLLASAGGAVTKRLLVLVAAILGALVLRRALSHRRG